MVVSALIPALSHVNARIFLPTYYYVHKSKDSKHFACIGLPKIGAVLAVCMVLLELEISAETITRLGMPLITAA